MPKILQFRRYTTSEINSLTGAVGELFIDTTKDTVVVQDGVTAGGTPLATESYVVSGLSTKQNTLVSGTSIKTIGGESILGSGNIALFSGSYNDLTNKPNIPTVPTNISAFSNDAGYITSSSLSSKQDTLISGTNIKTINGQSILGSGNLVISGDGGVLDTSQFATKVDLLILDSDDIDEGLTNQYFTKQKVANILTTGSHSGISFAFDGDSINASILGGGNSFDELRVKDRITLQQETTDIGTVVSKSIVPATTQFVEYASNQSGDRATNPIARDSNFDYGYIYSSYGDVYTSGNNDKLQELFAIGNTVRITVDNYWWDLQITNWPSWNSTWIRYNYITTGTNSPWNDPSNYFSYYSWNNNIKFSSDLPVAQRYVITLDQPIRTLVNGDKVSINDSLTGTPYNLTVTSIGSWDIGVNSTSVGTNEWRLDFGSYNYYSSQDNIRELLSTVGTLITLSDNNWMQSGVYEVTAIGTTDNTWGSSQGFNATLKYVSGTNYPNNYTSLSSIFQSYLLSASATITPNYTAEYFDRFTTQYNSTSYISFGNYDFLNIGDILQYISSTSSIEFKDDAGNNVKAITYNNSTGEMTYEGLPESEIVYVENYSNTFSKVAFNANQPLIGSSPRNPGVTHSVSIGLDSGNGGSNSVSIGNSAKGQNASVAIGRTSTAVQESVAVGAFARSGDVSSYAVAIGYNTVAPGHKHTNLSAQDHLSAYPWYTLPNLHYRQNYRRAVNALITNRAGISYIHTQFAGSSLQHSSSVQQFNLNEWLNMVVNCMATIKLRWHIASESYSSLSTYYAKGASEYLYTPNTPNPTKLISISSDTTVFGTDTYANELNITLENSSNNSSQQMMKFTANPSDTTNRRVVIDLEAIFS